MTANAKFLEDVTIPDKTAILAGTAFTKTWRVQNTGDEAWTAGYQLMFRDGINMAATGIVPLPNCAPGESVQISVAMTAPNRKGSCRSNWVCRDSQGVPFGELMYVLIDVKPNTNPVGQKSNYFVSDVTVPDDSVIQPGTRFVKTWRIRNTGTVAWTDKYTLNLVGGALKADQARINVPPVAPGGEVNLSVSLKAPTQPGKYASDWKMKDEKGQLFGVNFWTSIVVPGEPAAQTVEITAPIVLQAAAPHYSQRDAAWANVNLGHVAGAPTIARWGCMLTSFAMLASTMQHTVNPAQLNDLMVQKNGFSGGYLTKWNALQIVFGDILYETKLGGGADTIARIDACLQAGRPVPVQVDITPATAYSDNDQHWVLIVGRNEGDFWMNDPINFEAGPTSLMKRYGRSSGSLADSIVGAIFYKR